MDEQEILDWEAELAKQNIPYIDTEEANMPTPFRPSKLRQDLFFALQKNDLHLLVDTLKRIRSLGNKICDKPFRHESTGSTGLCFAIQHDRDEAVDIIMLYEKRDLLFEKYDYEHDDSQHNAAWREIAANSALTCLHLLAEKNKTRAARLFLRLCPMKTDEDIKELQRYLAVPVVKDIGRRYDTNAPGERLVSCVHIAAANGNTELVELLIKRGGEVDQTYSEEFTKASPMALAVENDRLETFRKLTSLSKIFGVEKKVEHVASFLKIASMAGAKLIVEELLQIAKEKHINKMQLFQDAVDEGCVEAIRMGHSDIAELLTSALDASKLNEALCEAVKRGNRALVEDLLAKGAKVDDATASKENLPLMLCVQHEKIDVLPSLLPKATLIPEEFWKGVAAAKDDFSRQVFDNYRKSKKDKEGKLKFSNNVITPMHIAASLDKIDVLLQFGNLGARYDLLDPHGNTILHTAAQHNAQIVVKEAMEYFNPAVKNKDGDTPLLIACKHSRPKIAEQMLKCKDDVLKTRNNAGDMPLHVAIKQLLSSRSRGKSVGEKVMYPPTREDRIETLEIVVQTYAAMSLLDEVDAKGNTALNLLVQEGRETEIRLFTNASPTVKNNEGLCALDYAMRSYYTKPTLLGSMLSTFGIKAAVYLATEFKHDGYPPLHLFAMKRDLQNVKLLVENGASVTELNDEGLTIMHMIAQLTTEDNNNEEVYILIARIIIDALVEYRIKRQIEFCRFLCDHYEGVFVQDHEPQRTIANQSPNVTKHKVESPIVVGCDDFIVTGKGDKIPLVVRSNENGGHRLPTMELANHNDGFSFFVSSKMSRDDIRRVLIVYLTRLVKSRDGLSVVNYAANMRAVDYLKYILEVRKRIDNKPQGSELKQLNETMEEPLPDKIEDDMMSNTDDKLEDNKRQMAAYEATLNNPQDYDALQPDTMLVSYDVSCLSPETMMSFSNSDVEWITLGLEEKFLHHVYDVLQKKKYLFETKDDVAAHGTSPFDRIMEKAKAWGIHELFIRLNERSHLPASEKKEPLRGTPEKKMSKRRRTCLSGSTCGLNSQSTREPAMLETIVELKDEVMAAKMLDLMPLTKLVESYWSVYRWMYFVIMLVHIIYMGIFSMVTIGDKPTCTNVTMTSEDTSIKDATNSPITINATLQSGENSITYPIQEYFIFLFYPFVFLIVTIYFEMVQVIARRRRRKVKNNLQQTATNRISAFFSNIMDVPYDSLTFFLENLPTIGSVAFAFCMLFWYLNYMEMCTNAEAKKGFNAAYLLSACLVIGWLQTITYSRGFESLHSFKNVMKSIVLSDILRFFMVYIFVNIGFSFGFHVLQLVFLPHMNEHQPTPLHSVFYNLKLFTNPADIFEIGDFTEFGSPLGLMYVRVAFLMYSFVSGLILVNILIAMMNDSYTRVNEMERITWRVGSLRQAMAVFRAFPFIMKIKERVSQGSESQTHLTTLIERPSVVLYDICCTVNVNDDEPELETDDRLDAIERDVKSLQVNVEEVTGKMDAMLDSREDMKMLMTALMTKVEECNSQLKLLSAAKPADVSAPVQRDATPSPSTTPADARASTPSTATVSPVTDSAPSLQTLTTIASPTSSTASS